MKTSPASKSAAYSYAVAGREHAKEELGGCGALAPAISCAWNDRSAPGRLCSRCMLCLEALPNDPREAGVLRHLWAHGQVVNLCASETLAF